MVKLGEIFLDKLREKEDLYQKEKKIFVGVDIGKEKNQISFLSKDKTKEIRKRIKIKNDIYGFRKLLKEIEEIMINENVTIEEILIGIESTGHYWKNFNNFFHEKNFNVVMVKSRIVKLKREVKYPYKGKNDSIDSHCIALVLKDNDYFRIRKSDKNYDSLRTLSRIKEETIKTSTQNKNRTRKWLDTNNQAYLDTFANPFCKTGIAILKIFPSPRDIKEKSIDEIKEAIKINNPKTKIQYKRVVEYIELARDICEENKKISLGEKRELENYLRIFESTEVILENIEKDINDLAKDMEIPVESFGEIKGLGKNEIIDFIAELGIIENYKCSKSVQAFFGLSIIGDTSGRTLIKKPRISKAGNRRGRKCLYHMALNLIGRNPDWRKLYAYYLSYNRDNPKTKKEMVIAVASKLCRTIFGMLKNNTKFDRDLLFRDLDFNKCNREKFIEEYIGEKRNWSISDEELEELFDKPNLNRIF